MKLFVIGATGRTGGEIVKQALTRGHQVTAFVRSPEGIQVGSEQVVQSNGLDWTLARHFQKIVGIER